MVTVSTPHREFGELRKLPRPLSRRVLDKLGWPLLLSLIAAACGALVTVVVVAAEAHFLTVAKAATAYAPASIEQREAEHYADVLRRFEQYEQRNAADHSEIKRLNEQILDVLLRGRR